MGFALKKFVGFFLMPVPLCLVLLGLGWLLTRRNRAGSRGRMLISAGLFLLLLFSNRAASNGLLRPLENRYASVPEIAPGQPLPPQLAACRAVVVLGSGHAQTPELAATNRLSYSGLERIVEGVRILRLLPQAPLIVSGPSDRGQQSHASVLAEAAVSLGVDPARIRRIENGHDTEEESVAVAKLLGPGPVALVTSAAHMPRAGALFRKAGIAFFPCPTDYSSRFNQEVHWQDYLWDSESLDRSTWAVRERIGYLWLKLRHKVD
jgi:uncharacterized SAM-binding protein YcdF (DUF218 family)